MEITLRLPFPVMNQSVTIYHNPRCSKSRQTLALLEARGIEPTIVRYLDEPPDAGTIRELLDELGLEPRALMRTKEARYRELGLDDADDDTLIRAMADNPVLIERPIVVTGKGARLGRPPETVLEVL
jgi:arsenate reductase